ncbi:hypothetical protein CJO80_27140 (plasmid) [Ralstonia solanacearum]|nr:hypothetical protein CJO80_27140 [Ralstonia solanacearum]
MYRIYLRDQQQTVPGSQTSTSNPDAAREAFAALINRTDLDGQKLAAMLTYNNRHLACHRFDRSPDRQDYWRDKLDEIAWPTVGRPATGQSGRRTNIYLSDDSRVIAERLGNGNVSEGIRIALVRGAAKRRAGTGRVE